MLPKIQINHIDYEAAQEVINEVNALTSKVDSLTKEITTLKEAAVKKDAEFDTMKEDRDTLKAKVDGFDKDLTTKIDEGVKTRTELIGVASQILKKEDFAKIDSMSNEEVKKAVIMAKSPTAKLDDKEEIYITARYDSIVENENFDPTAINQQRKDSTSRHTPHVDEVEKAKTDAEDKMMNAHLDFGKTN